jgi:hypothetical protein
MGESRTVLSCVLLLVLATLGCESPKDRVSREVEKAAACEPGDVCVLAGGGSCSCPQAVNAEHADRIDDLAHDLECAGEVGCKAYEQVQCIDGRCVGSYDPLDGGI